MGSLIIQVFPKEYRAFIIIISLSTLMKMFSQAPLKLNRKHFKTQDDNQCFEMILDCLDKNKVLNILWFGRNA